MREYKRAWAERNRDRVNAYARARYAENAESANAFTKRWQKENRDRYLESQRLYRQSNADKIRAKNQRRYAMQRGATTVAFTADDLQQKWDYYGRRCYMCGSKATATDHVKPLAKGGPHMLANLRPACTPCNSAKQDTWPYRIAREQHV